MRRSRGLSDQARSKRECDQQDQNPREGLHGPHGNLVEEPRRQEYTGESGDDPGQNQRHRPCSKPPVCPAKKNTAAYTMTRHVSTRRPMTEFVPTNDCVEMPTFTRNADRTAPW
jgi:hypothetical protein